MLGKKGEVVNPCSEFVLALKNDLDSMLYFITEFCPLYCL